MDLKLKNKTALITGSTKGIGKAIANALAQEGANVIINGRNPKVVNEVVKELQERYEETSVQGAAYDLTDGQALDSLFTEFPEIDILVNNMGIFKPMDYFEITDEVWQQFIDTNVMVGNKLARYYLPKMLTQNFGRIIFIASEEAIMPSGEMPQYSMTKTMNLSLAKSLSKLTVGTKVTVNTVMPGSTLTEGVQEMLDEMYAEKGFTQEQKEQDFMKHHRPLSQIQRLIRPEEIGSFVAYVSSPIAGGFSGEALRMDGGLVPTLF
ncbi:SDR family oxidoreductase [Enterococcus sp. DIV0660C]|uniref:SDR family NAD(P)-dependent oxidoreductase n=1 Tax=Enterococcus sp. DIV0660C TaxID=2230880 RepID=UPI001A8FE423|nr:SDR family oxidoreductase [Enterococcus sp. DIV0660C]MBO0430869.1 SDR family oxidoreductase [Enterococcus sp. DIV0660C]